MSETATARKIKQTLGTILNDPLQGDAVLLAKVVSVNEEEATCVVDPVDESAQLFDVRLQAEVGKGILIIPKIDSEVIVTMINNVNGHVTMFSDVEKVILLDGSYDGLVKVKDLTDKLNNAENKINSLIQKWNAFCAAYVPGSPSTVGLPPTLATSTETELTPTKQSEIENELITHGTN